MSLSELLKSVETLPTWPLLRSLAYQMPKGYYPWRVLGGIGAVALASARGEHDHSTRLTVAGCQEWCKAQWPLYCISTSLLRNFEQTDVSDLEKLIPDDWEPPLPGFLLALPENAVRSPAGFPVPYQKTG